MAYAEAMMRSIVDKILNFRGLPLNLFNIMCNLFNLMDSIWKIAPELYGRIIILKSCKLSIDYKFKIIALISYQSEQ